MDFISLYDLMDELASNTAPKYSNSEEARYSEAAADLHQWLMSSTGRPQWLKINKNTRRPVPDNNVSDKGIAMLEHMAGWEGRTHAAYCRYRSELARAEAQGIDESLILPGINQADLMYKGADYLQAMEIGFDKKEISEFIERFKRQYSPKPEIKPEADHRAESESVKDDAENQVDPTTSERELTRWLRETWIKENKPNGTGFFNALKKYVDKEGSPIVEHYTASKKGAGIRWNTGSATNTMSKKAIQNNVSKFKKEP